MRTTLDNSKLFGTSPFSKYLLILAVNGTHTNSFIFSTKDGINAIMATTLFAFHTSNDL